MRKYYDRDKGLKIIFSIIYPLGAFFYSMKDLKSRSSYLVFFLFFILFGFSMTGEYEPEDSSRYVEEFYTFSNNASYNYSSIISEYFGKDSEIKDIYSYTLYYITVFIGGNHRVLFGLIATIFAFFMLESFKFLTKDNSFKNQSFFYCLAFIFIVSNSIFNINGFRFWTATWIAVYATFQIVIGGRKRFLLLLFLIPMVHGSFYIYIVFFIIGFFVKSHYKLLPYLFFVSFFVTDVALTILPDITDYLPSFLQKMVWNYTMSDTALDRMAGLQQQAVPLYAKVLNALPTYFSIILIFLLVCSREHFVDEQSKSFLGFVLAVGCFVNFSKMIPSMGRFWYIIIPFYVYLWVHNSSVMMQYKRFLIYAVPIVYFYPLFLLLRKISWTTDPILYLTNAPHILVHSILQ